MAAVVEELESGRVCLAGIFREVPVSTLTAELRSEDPKDRRHEPTPAIQSDRGGEAGLTHYCLRCLAPALENQPQCSRCATPFWGAGSFDLVAGPPPSREFAFLFTRESEARSWR